MVKGGKCSRDYTHPCPPPLFMHNPGLAIFSPTIRTFSLSFPLSPIPAGLLATLREEGCASIVRQGRCRAIVNASGERAASGLLLSFLIVESCWRLARRITRVSSRNFGIFTRVSKGVFVRSATKILRQKSGQMVIVRVCIMKRNLHLAV